MSKKELWRVSDVMRELGYGYPKSKRIWVVAKSLDKDPYNLRCMETPAHTVFKALGLSDKAYNRHMKQNDEK